MRSLQQRSDELPQVRRECRSTVRHLKIVFIETDLCRCQITGTVATALDFEIESANDLVAGDSSPPPNKPPFVLMLDSGRYDDSSIDASRVMNNKGTVIVFCNNRAFDLVLLPAVSERICAPER